MVLSWILAPGLFFKLLLLRLLDCEAFRASLASLVLVASARQSATCCAVQQLNPVAPCNVKPEVSSKKRKRSQYLASSQSRWYQYPACRHFSRRANLVQSCSSLANELRDLNFVKRQLIAGACIFLPRAVWWVGYLRELNELSSLKHSNSTLATKLQSHFQVPWFGLTSMCNLLSLSCLILFDSVRFCSSVCTSFSFTAWTVSSSAVRARPTLDPRKCTQASTATFQRDPNGRVH